MAVLLLQMLKCVRGVLNYYTKAKVSGLRVRKTPPTISNLESNQDRNGWPVGSWECPQDFQVSKLWLQVVMIREAQTAQE